MRGGIRVCLYVLDTYACVVASLYHPVSLLFRRDRELRNDETEKLRRKVAQLEQELQQCHSVLKAVDEEYSACPHLERPKAWELVHALYDGSLAYLERIAGVGRGLRGRQDRWDTGLDIVDVERLGGEGRRGSFASRTSATANGQRSSASLRGAEMPAGPANQQAPVRLNERGGEGCFLVRRASLCEWWCLEEEEESNFCQIEAVGEDHKEILHVCSNTILSSFTKVLKCLVRVVVLLPAEEA